MGGGGGRQGFGAGAIIVFFDRSPRLALVCHGSCGGRPALGGSWENPGENSAPAERLRCQEAAGENGSS